MSPARELLQRTATGLRQAFDDEQITLVAVALVVGLAAGCCAVLFRELLAIFQSIFLGTGEEDLTEFIAGLPAWKIVLAPTVGGLLVGIYIRVFLRGRPMGVAQVMEASAAGGRMELVPALHGAVANALTLGAGGSSGREGPVVHLGAAAASWLARRFHNRRGAARTLLACGVAGAVAASFNAPFAGIFFAQEVVIGRYAFGALVPVAVSSVVATLISHAVYGAYPAFIVPEFSLGSWLEFPAFVLLGGVTAVTAVIFIRSIRITARLAEASTVPAWMRPALAGLAVGLIAVVFPQVLGVGYGATDNALKAEYGLWLLIGLIVAKTAATSLTIGGGMGGGVFSPSLFLGAMLGGAFGSVAGSVAPHLFAGVGAYALVGMGAMAGAVLGAPISTILIMVELTGDYQLTMAVTLATVTAAMLTRALNGASYFRTVLAESGIDLDESLETDAMRADARARRDEPVLLLRAAHHEDAGVAGRARNGPLRRALRRRSVEPPVRHHHARGPGRSGVRPCDPGPDLRRRRRKAEPAHADGGRRPRKRLQPDGDAARGAYRRGGQPGGPAPGRLHPRARRDACLQPRSGRYAPPRGNGLLTSAHSSPEGARPILWPRRSRRSGGTTLAAMEASRASNSP